MFLTSGLVRVFVEDMKLPEMYDARELATNDNRLLDMTLMYLVILINVAQVSEFNSRFVTLAREVQLVATLKNCHRQ